jgi:ribonuclease HI
VGTNNKAEMSALWVLLTLAVEKDISRVQILGDSKLENNWANGKNNVENLNLNPIMERIFEEAGLK